MKEATNKIDLSGDGGVLKEIIKEGTGLERPWPGCNVSMHYTGRLVDGTVFDSSVERQPFEFQLGKGHVIRAFDMGASSMLLGEKIFLTCAPEYAYGEAGSPPSIPPYSTLIFELEMLGWRGEDLSPNNDGSIERFIMEPSPKRKSKKILQGASVDVHLTGRYDGCVFEDRDVQFDYGEGNDSEIIEGVEIALEKMVVGETSRLVIHPKYAFGSKGNEQYAIPPNATVEYIVKLKNAEKGIQEWTLSAEERFEHAKIYKEKGTKYFKKQNYALALKMYNRCKEFIGTDPNPDFNTLKAAAHNNMGLCHQKLNDEFEAVKSCNEVLKLEPNNIKALYRRAQCSVVVNELERALEDFQKVIQLEPSNKAAQNQIQICRNKIKENREREKKIYANMFSKLSVDDKQEIKTTEPDVLDGCGEWSEEEARQEAKSSASFERDNNIVMI